MHFRGELKSCRFSKDESSKGVCTWAFVLNLKSEDALASPTRRTVVQKEYVGTVEAATRRHQEAS